MSNLEISTYGTPHWGAKATGMATIRKDTQAQYHVNEALVTTVENDGLFTILGCADGRSYNVLTAFFKLADRPDAPSRVQPEVPGLV